MVFCFKNTILLKDQGVSKQIIKNIFKESNSSLILIIYGLHFVFQ